MAKNGPENNNQERDKQNAEEWSLKRMKALVDPKSNEYICIYGVRAKSAESEIKSTGASVDVLTEAFDRLEYENNELDTLICRHSLHHFSDKPGFFREAFRVLKPGGKLYVSDPVMTENLRVRWSLLTRLLEPDYRGYCTDAEIRDLIEPKEESDYEIKHYSYYLFPRKLHEWVYGKLPKGLSDSQDLSMHGVALKAIAEEIKDIVLDFPPGLRRELHLRKQTINSSRESNNDEGEYLFAYTCAEILAEKK